jgi:pimeloyl-ACP methyl ester carboxylesterase
MLGKPRFRYNNKTYERKEYSIISTQGYILKCSFIEPSKKYRPSILMPVVVYLHGNSSSRMEGLQLCEIILKNNINLFVFDFAGSGLSEGKYISLGYHESNDLENVINFVEKIEGVGNIGIWGRSMGAATTMIYAHRNRRIKAICLDSPFADFMELAKEIVLQQITLPSFLIVGMLKIIGSTIFDKNGLDIEKLKPIDSAPKTFQPALFIHAKNDKLINVNHSIELFHKYGGKDKKIKILDKGGHTIVGIRKLLMK